MVVNMLNRFERGATALQQHDVKPMEPQSYDSFKRKTLNKVKNKKH